MKSSTPLAARASSIPLSSDNRAPPRYRSAVTPKNNALRIARRFFRTAGGLIAIVLLTYGVFVMAQDWGERCRILATGLVLAVYAMGGFGD
jgi:hypothetical protein